MEVCLDDCPLYSLEVPCTPRLGWVNINTGLATIVVRDEDEWGYWLAWNLGP